MLAALFANLIILVTLGSAGLLLAIDAELYYRSAQEDEFLEWATFWAFVVAATRFLVNAVVDRRRGGVPWFHVGLGIFCLFVALEEISWGQRLLAYRAPEYFLASNYQQEFNLHNVVDTDLRKLAVQAVLFGYGVLLSAAGLLKPLRDWLNRLGVVISPPALIPSFAAMAIGYAWYPVDFTGEWVECAMGLGFAFIAILTIPDLPRRTAFRHIFVLTTSILILTPLTIAASQLVHGSDDVRVELAWQEVQALAKDFDGPNVHTRCGIHKRLYTFVQQYGQDYLLKGEFATLAASAAAGGRARYLLDPWNSPYWVRHKCANGRSVAFVYTFGPNRRRDSTEWELHTDDIGVILQTRR